MPQSITAIIDAGILSDQLCLGAQILSTLSDAGVQTRQLKSTTLPPHSITWQRSGTSTSTADAPVDADDHALLVWFVADLSASLRNNTLSHQISNAHRRVNNRPSTLLLCGSASELKRNQHQIDRALIRVQLQFNIGYQLVPSAAELAQIVLRFTKSVAEAPHKRMNEADECGFYVANDNRDCVLVRDGIGLSSLWQHQLCKLPLASLETAEAIMGAYAMPRVLLDAYDAGGGGDVLSAIPVRRTAGTVLSTARKIGPELSARIHTLYTSDDPDKVL